MLRWVRIATFLALITLPLIMMDSGSGSLKSEKRQRAPRPSLAAGAASLPQQFDAFFRDHVGFRDSLIRLHHVLKVKYLNESPVPNVIVGNTGWLFYAGYSDGLDIRDFAGKYRADHLAVDRWLESQLTRQAEYAARGIRYLIVLIPNKQSMYPEHVPARYGPQAPGALDAWLARARHHPELEMIDLRPILQAHLDEPLFYKLDTHWNGHGVFYAAQAIVARIHTWFPAVAPLQREDYSITTSPRGGGDLATMLALDDAFTDTSYDYTPLNPTGARLVQAEHRIWERPEAALPRLLLLGDSFGEGLADRLADSFARVYYYNSPGYKRALLSEEQPDVVVLAFCERYLHYLGE